MYNKGYTLTELLIVVAIIGILVAIVYPSYQEQIREARRSDAKIALMETAQVLERCYSEYHVFDDAGCVAVDGNNLHSDYTSSKEGYYTISTTVLTTSTFTLQAVPAGTQSGDTCANFTYTHAGSKGVSGSGDCW